MPEVQSWFSNLGHGNPQIYYNHIVRNDAPNYAEVFVQLHEYDTDETPRELRGAARAARAATRARIYM